MPDTPRPVYAPSGSDGTIESVGGKSPSPYHPDIEQNNHHDINHSHRHLHHSSHHHQQSHEEHEPRYQRPTGLKGLYYNAFTQVTLLGFVCFMCPGLFNALNGLGGGGQVDPTTSANANSTLYSTFAFFAFFSGSVNNVIGSKNTLRLGSIGYALYIGSYLAVNIHPNAGGFVIGAGAILGICAALLWTAQGSLMLAYPTESQKGKCIGIFWSVFNLGGVVGAAVSLGQNFHSEANSVGNGTYIGFLALTLIGVFIPLIMADPDKMVRDDGTKVTTPRHPSWKSEFAGLWIALRTDPYIILLFPMFFASNWFYTWQFNDYNGAIFNIRARSLNNLVYWLAQIVGSVSIGFLLDQRGLSRRVRAFSGWGVLVVMVFAVHIWAYFYQRGYARATVSAKIDIFDSTYTGRLMLYIMCGLLDAMWQTCAYWLMGAMSNDPAKLAHFTGFYKGLQSAGAAGIWRADAVGVPYMSMFMSTWALLVAGLFFSLPMIHMRVHDTSEEDDGRFVADVDPEMVERGVGTQSTEEYHRQTDMRRNVSYHPHPRSSSSQPSHDQIYYTYGR